jgi:hypothetical protein
LIRAGYTDDSGFLLEKSVSVGFGFQPDPSTAVPGDLFGAAINWGEVNDLPLTPVFTIARIAITLPSNKVHYSFSVLK